MVAASELYAIVRAAFLSRKRNTTIERQPEESRKSQVSWTICKVRPLPNASNTPSDHGESQTRRLFDS
eukprot:s2260_g3.t1